MSSFIAPFRVTLWDNTGSGHGRGTVKAIIDDARDIGVSGYANQGGECFFTLPWNHPAINEIVPWQRHYEVKRYNRTTGIYDVVGVGWIDDYDATADEVIVYGTDYLSGFDLSISSSGTSYNNTLIGTIITAQATDAMHGVVGGATPIIDFLTTGTIDATSQTVTVLTSYQPRLQFFQQLADIYQSDSSVRPIVYVARSSPFTFNFDSNRGSDKTTRRFEWGALVNDFRYLAGFKNFATWGFAIGQKREGASILTSAQSYASSATYGIMQRATLFIDVVNQAALDKKTKRFARNIGTPAGQVSIGLRANQIGPYEWGDFGDSVPVVINRGLVQVNGLYTVWGQEWIGQKDGSEDLFLSIAPKET